jgi:uncharacterized protein (DUF1684 family)
MLPAFSQLDPAKQKEAILKFQEEMNIQFADPEDSPLEEKDKEHFTGLEFFPINLDFTFEAEFVRTPNEAPFMMKRTKDEVKYQKYGEIYFNYQGKEYKLNAYQNLRYIERGGDADYLFIPFNDLTNDESTYGGGRYIDTDIPEGPAIIIDFNQAYNPYCAYNKKYSCPIPPRENDLQIRVEAGVKAFH